MTKFIRNIIILAIPFGLYLIIIAIVDPFNYLNRSSPVDSSVKRRISSNVSPHLYRLLDFENNPKRNILFGDSRTGSLYRCMDQDQWANLGFEGGSIKEIVQAFNWVTETYQFDTIIMQVSLNNYNKFNKRFHVEQALGTKKNFFSYALSKNVVRASYLIIKDQASKDEVRINSTAKNKEEFWQFHLETVPVKHFKKFAYPEGYHQDLVYISEYCLENQIKLIIWTPPTHMDYQNIVGEYNIDEAREVFIKDVKQLADFYYYDYQSSLTSDKENFRDPMHFNQDVAARIRDELTLGQPYMAHISLIIEEP